MSKLRPPCSSEISASSSVIAEATQIASRWCTRPVRAVTRPPPPRLASSSPSSVRTNVAGPRLETRTSGVCWVMASGASGEDTQPVAKQPRHEEVRPHVLLPGATQLLAQVGLTEDSQGALRAFLRRADEEARVSVLHLEGDAPHVSADERTRLPQGLGDREAEALAGGLLDHHVGL